MKKWAFKRIVIKLLKMTGLIRLQPAGFSPELTRCVLAAAL